MITYIMTTVLPFCKGFITKPFNKKNLNTTLIIIIIILILLSLKTCKSNADLKKEAAHQEAIASNNYASLSDTVTILKTKNGELESTKIILYADVAQLKVLNAKLFSDLEKEKGNVKVIVKTKTEVKYIPVTVPNTVLNYGGGKYGLGFTTVYKDSGLVSEMEGVSDFHVSSDYQILPDSTHITKNKMTIDITYGVRERDKKIEVFARSKSPLVSFNEIEGAYIPTTGNSVLPNEPKPPIKQTRWSFGPQLGYQYNLTTQKSNYQFIGNLQYRISGVTVGFQGGMGYTPNNIPGSYPVDYIMGFRLQYNLFKW